MTKKQINAFEELLQDSDFKGKNQLRHLLWLNTTKPKFKLGDKVIFTDSKQRTYGVPMINFIGYIKGISSFKNENEYYYDIAVPVRNGNKEHTGYTCIAECDLKLCNSNKTVNVIKGINDFVASTSI